MTLDALFALHAADGTPIMVTDTREAAIANARVAYGAFRTIFDRPEARNALDSLIFQSEKMLRENGDTRNVLAVTQTYSELQATSLDEDAVGELVSVHDVVRSAIRTAGVQRIRGRRVVGRELAVRTGGTFGRASVPDRDPESERPELEHNRGIRDATPPKHTNESSPPRGDASPRQREPQSKDPPPQVRARPQHDSLLQQGHVGVGHQPAQFAFRHAFESNGSGAQLYRIVAAPKAHDVVIAVICQHHHWFVIHRSRRAIFRTSSSVSEASIFRLMSRAVSLLTLRAGGEVRQVTVINRQRPPL